MKTVFNLLLALVFFYTAHGQKITIENEEVERVFRSTDSSHNFYLVMVPNQKPEGLIVILPGFGGYPRGIIEGCNLPSKARKKGFVVVMPYLAVESFYLDTVAQKNLETLIPELLGKYKIPSGKFILGGHSAGGNAALLYAAKAFKENNLVKPSLVFAVDPPLDMKRFRNTVQHEIAIGYRKESVNAMKEFLNVFEGMVGGPPDRVPERYQNLSAYYRDAADGGNTKYLKDVPIRLYCDPDVNWSIEKLGVGYEHLNASDLSACVAQLKLLGNKNAELVVNLGKGKLDDGTRHPHAISQLDGYEFLSWAERMLKHSR